MAIDFNQKYLDTLRFPSLPTLHFLIKVRKLIVIQRAFERRLFPARSEKSDYKGKKLINSCFEQGAKHYRDHGYVFLENILDNQFFTQLVKNYPKVQYLDPPSDLYKSYNRGMQWVRGMKQNPLYHDLYPHVSDFLTYLRSQEFGQRVSNLAGDQIQRSCYSFLVTSSVTGSNVAPHRDSISVGSSKYSKGFMNMVFFIKGTGGSNSGGLAILGDNTFEQVIFEPYNLINSVLIYNSLFPFYHGFAPIAFRKKRLAIIAQFCSVQYDGL